MDFHKTLRLVKKPVSAGGSFWMGAATGVFFSAPNVLSQTVGPEISLRDNAVGGAVIGVTAAFEADSAFVAWQDNRAEGNNGGDIYVQKLGPDGTPAWTVNGLPVCTASGTQWLANLHPDGANGVAVAWFDSRSNPDSIAAQRVSAGGAIQWAADGVFAGVAYIEAPRPFIYRSGNDGFITTWWDSSPNFSDDSQPLLAQKLSLTGDQLWDPGAADPNDTWGPGIEVLDGIVRGRSVSDGNGGVIAFGKISDGGFRFQRIGADQTFAWAAPVDFSATLADTVSFSFDSDGAGGVVVAYITGSTVKAFRVTGAGELAWGSTGVTVAPSNIVTFEPAVVAGDGQGGAFIGWLASSPRDLRIQHFSATGQAQWSAEGAIVPDGSASERSAALVHDGAGGVFISFATATSLRGQRLNSSGAAQWFTGASNGLNLGSGNDAPLIGAASTGPVVIYTRGSGIFARKITLPAPLLLRFSGIDLDPPGLVTLTLQGGSAGMDYEVLRSSELLNGSWSQVGTIQSGGSWTDVSPLATSAVYFVRDPAR